MRPCGSPLHREQFRTYFYLGTHERSNVAKFNETYSGALGMFLLLFGLRSLNRDGEKPQVFKPLRLLARLARPGFLSGVSKVVVEG